MSNRKSGKCLFVHKGLSTFTANDLELLREEFEVKEVTTKHQYGLAFFLGQLAVLWQVLRGLWGAQFVFIWFAGYHALLPAFIFWLARKRVYLVIGGYDAAYLPEIKYGGHIKPLLKWCIVQSCKFSTKILPVSEFAEAQILRHLPSRSKDKSIVIHNGINYELMCEQRGVIRKSLVATICGGSTLIRLKVKGIDFYLKVARATPEVQFLLVGLSGEALEWVLKHKTKNVEIIPWVENAELPRLLSEISVICQFSRYEAFGVALVEGMACGCVPIGSTFTATKEIVEGTPGLLIDELEVLQGVEAVREALTLTNELVRAKLRTTVVRKFSLDIRKQALLTLLKDKQPTK